MFLWRGYIKRSVNEKKSHYLYREFHDSRRVASAEKTTIVPVWVKQHLILLKVHTTLRKHTNMQVIGKQTLKEISKKCVNGQLKKNNDLSRQTQQNFVSGAEAFWSETWGKGGWGTGNARQAGYTDKIISPNKLQYSTSLSTQQTLLIVFDSISIFLAIHGQPSPFLTTGPRRPRVLLESEACFRCFQCQENKKSASSQMIRASSPIGTFPRATKSTSISQK